MQLNFSAVNFKFSICWLELSLAVCPIFGVNCLCSSYVGPLKVNSIRYPCVTVTCWVNLTFPHLGIWCAKNQIFQHIKLQIRLDCDSNFVSSQNHIVKTAVQIWGYHRSKSWFYWDVRWFRHKCMLHVTTTKFQQQQHWLHGWQKIQVKLCDGKAIDIGRPSC